jgi:senataxin
MPNLDARDVKNVLADLRDNPADTTRASDAILQQIYLYLMKVPPNDAGEIHWFCKLAVPTTVEAATFLIRLMAYQSEEVNKWKSKLHRCLSICASCVQGLELAKVASQHTLSLSPRLLVLFQLTSFQM